MEENTRRTVPCVDLWRTCTNEDSIQASLPSIPLHRDRTSGDHGWRAFFFLPEDPDIGTRSRALKFSPAFSILIAGELRSPSSHLSVSSLELFQLSCSWAFDSSLIASLLNPLLLRCHFDYLLLSITVIPCHGTSNVNIEHCQSSDSFLWLLNNDISSVTGFLCSP